MKSPALPLLLVDGVVSLRGKLGDDAIASVHIKTVRPHGYLFSPSAW